MSDKIKPITYIGDQNIIRRSGAVMKHPVESIRLEHLPQSRFDVLLSVLGTTMSRFLNPNRPRNALIDTNAIYLTMDGQSSIDLLAVEIERNSVWKRM